MCSEVGEILHINSPKCVLGNKAKNSEYILVVVAHVFVSTAQNLYLYTRLSHSYCRRLSSGCGSEIRETIKVQQCLSTAHLRLKSDIPKNTSTASRAQEVVSYAISERLSQTGIVELITIPANLRYNSVVKSRSLKVETDTTAIKRVNGKYISC